MVSDDPQLLGLCIQAAGALLIAVLCLMLNRVVRSGALSAWVRGWCSLGLALVALVVEQSLPSSASLTLPVYLGGEYFFAYWIVAGCAHFSRRSWPSRLLPRAALPTLVIAACLPQLVGYEFSRLFMVQSAVLAAAFLGSLIALRPAASRGIGGGGLLALRASLAMLAIIFLSYLPIFAANVAFDRPLPMGYLHASSAAHLLFEFLLGFGGAVLVLEQSRKGLAGENDALNNEIEKYRGQAERDALTNAYNRRALIERLTQLLDDAGRKARKVFLLYLDIDDFKEVNDTHGHAIGDQLLIAVARTLQDCVTNEDLVVRMGGDEFIVIVTSAQSTDAIAELAAQIIALLAAPISLTSASIRVQASIGVSTFPDDGSGAETLLQRADTALYQAKSCGKNTFRSFDALTDRRNRERVVLSRALSEGIGSDQVYVEYQPIVDLQTRSVVAMEALARWRHPEHGLIGPADFIPLAEQGGFIGALSDNVLRQVCRQLQAWRVAFLPLVPIAVNVSSRQFEDPGLAASFGNIMQEFDVDPALIRIEITETELMRHDHLHTLQELRTLGIKVAIDDFGTGYSSLSYLKHLPIDCLKIDKVFVAQMTTDRRDVAIVQSVIGIARSMDMAVVAEGVESEQQVLALQKLGCKQAQGYYFYKPMSAERCTQLLATPGTFGGAAAAADEPAMRWAPLAS